jgi:hypothetical protein
MRLVGPVRPWQTADQWFRLLEEGQIDGKRPTLVFDITFEGVFACL